MLDLPPVTEIRSSSLVMLKLLLLGIAFTLAGVLIATGKIGHVADGSYKQFVVLFGIVFFGAATLYSLWRLLHAGEILLRLTPEHLWIKGGNEGLTVSWTDVIGISSFPKNPRIDYLERFPIMLVRSLH